MGSRQLWVKAYSDAACLAAVLGWLGESATNCGRPIQTNTLDFGPPGWVEGPTLSRRSDDSILAFLETKKQTIPPPLGPCDVPFGTSQTRGANSSIRPALSTKVSSTVQLAHNLPVQTIRRKWVWLKIPKTYKLLSWFPSEVPFLGDSKTYRF